MSFEKVNEVPFTLRRKQRSTLGQYWATMGFIFQILRDIHPQLKILIDTMTLIGIVWSVRTGLNLFLTVCSGKSVVWLLSLKTVTSTLLLIMVSFHGRHFWTFSLNRFSNPCLVTISNSEPEGSLWRVGRHHWSHGWYWSWVCERVCQERSFPHFGWKKRNKVEQIKAGTVATRQPQQDCHCRARLQSS